MNGIKGQESHCLSGLSETPETHQKVFVVRSTTTACKQLASKSAKWQNFGAGESEYCTAMDLDKGLQRLEGKLCAFCSTGAHMYQIPLSDILENLYGRPTISGSRSDPGPAASPPSKPAPSSLALPWAGRRSNSTSRPCSFEEAEWLLNPCHKAGAGAGAGAGASSLAAREGEGPRSVRVGWGCGTSAGACTAPTTSTSCSCRSIPRVSKGRQKDASAAARHSVPSRTSEARGSRSATKYTAGGQRGEEARVQWEKQGPAATRHRREIESSPIRMCTGSPSR
jgi:hypothetical protein